MAVLAVVIILIAATWYVFWGRNQFLLKKISSETQLVFPPLSKVEKFVSNGSLIDSIWVSEIEFDDVYDSAFLKQLDDKPAEDSTVLGSLHETIDWWPRSNAILSKHYMNGEHHLVQVVLSKSQGKAIVHIEHAIF